MKLLKKYFLFVAETPIFTAFYLLLLPTTFGLMFFAIFHEFNEQDLAYLQSNFWGGIIIFMSLFFLLSFLNLYVVKAKITTIPSLKENELTLIHYPSPGSEVKIARKSVWGKYLKTIIRFPSNWVAEVKKGDENYFHAEITIIINSDVRLFVTITFNFVFSGPFVAEDLRSKFMNGYILDEVDVNKLMEEKFVKLNLSGDTFAKITQDAKSYYNKSMNKREFIDSLVHTIKFPKPFSNVAAIGLNVEKVKFNYSTLMNE